ncbi:hypothetical protein TNCV_4094651 [Trichonephila clavipes]|uniref:Uncharacterized protein n=1 Tax=Trichonephila clavipes TaxID=2585209 RepID=A0A8X6VIU9_TRICX|nr:hypothetical protein TNCV_4094651 [Trichonephila clavipes]
MHAHHHGAPSCGHHHDAIMVSSWLPSPRPLIMSTITNTMAIITWSPSWSVATRSSSDKLTTILIMVPWSLIMVIIRTSHGVECFMFQRSCAGRPQL